MLLSVQALLSSPNPDDPLATDVAKHYKVRMLSQLSLRRTAPLTEYFTFLGFQENEKEAIAQSQEWTKKYAA